MGSNREKSNIAIAILDKWPFLKGNKNYFAFDGSNNIFADCRIGYHVDARMVYNKRESESSFKRYGPRYMIQVQFIKNFVFESINIWEE